MPSVSVQVAFVQFHFKDSVILSGSVCMQRCRREVNKDLELDDLEPLGVPALRTCRTLSLRSNSITWTSLRKLACLLRGSDDSDDNAGDGGGAAGSIRLPPRDPIATQSTSYR